MTQLLYYEDPNLLEFEARVLSARREQGHPEVILDRTAFYPEGGGQPADSGNVAGMPVVHVRKEDEHVVHVLHQDATDLPAGTVRCQVDLQRRRDYRQQHTGQHIVSAALMNVGNYATVSVHQGADHTTIEIDAEQIPLTDLHAVEALANQAIEDDIPVTATWVTDDEIGAYPLRRPPKVSGSIRIVQIGDLDCVACGGVHVNRTGQIRLVHAISVESIRGHARIAWKIGDRALQHYATTSGVVSELCSMLSAQPEELGARVAKQESAVKEAELENRGLKQRIHRHVAHSLLTDAETTHGRRLVTAEFDDEPKDFLRGLTEELVSHTGVAACLVNRANGRVQWSIGIGPGSSVSFDELRNELLPIIDAKGGGKPPIWQGIGTNPGGAQEFLIRFRRTGEQKLSDG